MIEVMDWGAWWVTWNGVVWGSAVGLLFSIWTGWYFFRLDQDTKRLSAWPLSRTRVIVADSTHRGMISVLYEGQEVHDLRATVIRLTNTGKLPVLAEDFKVGPIKIDLEEAKLLTWEICGQSNYDIVGDWHNDLLAEKSSSIIGFTPSFLNAREWVDLRFITDGWFSGHKVECRFAGQTQSMEDIRAKEWRRFLITMLSFLVAALALAHFTIGVGAAMQILGIGIVIFATVKLYRSESAWKAKNHFYARVSKQVRRLRDTVS